MVAVMRVYVDFGGSDNTPGTSTDTTGLGAPNIRMKTGDDATIDNANPIPIPASGALTNRSFWKNVYLQCSTAPDTQIDNVKLYTDGTGFGTGIEMWVGDGVQLGSSGATPGYSVAIGTVGDTGTIITSHSDVAATSDVFGYTSGSPRDVSVNEVGSVINAIGERTDYVVLQMMVASNASSGNLSDETFTFRYDEI